MENLDIFLRFLGDLVAHLYYRIRATSHLQLFHDLLPLSGAYIHYGSPHSLFVSCYLRHSAEGLCHRSLAQSSSTPTSGATWLPSTTPPRSTRGGPSLPPTGARERKGRAWGRVGGAAAPSRTQSPTTNLVIRYTILHVNLAQSGTLLHLDTLHHGLVSWRIHH